MPNARKTAFVSGAGRNIGRAIALELARRGCDVIVNGSSNADACEETAENVRRQHGVRAQVAMGDVGEAGAASALAEAALSQFGRVDILVNNAAIRPSQPFLDMTDAQWQRVLDVGLYGAFRLSRAFLPGMAERGWGRIVNLTGMHAIHGYEGRAAVSVAKHGLWGLTKALAKEFGPQGITVNAISPGAIRPDYASEEEQARRTATMAPHIPVARLGEPAEIAALAGHIASDEGGFLNGQMIACNGGEQT